MTTADLYRWSLSAVQAREAAMILASHPGAATAWHQALDAIISSDSRQRDSVWAMVTIAFNALADVTVDRWKRGRLPGKLPPLASRPDGKVRLEAPKAARMPATGLPARPSCSLRQ